MSEFLKYFYSIFSLENPAILRFASDPRTGASNPHTGASDPHTGASERRIGGRICTCEFKFDSNFEFVFVVVVGFYAVFGFIALIWYRNSDPKNLLFVGNLDLGP